MDNGLEEIRSVIEQIKAQLKAKPENKDKTDDEIDEIILNGFLKEFDSPDSEMTKDDLLGIMELMGYEPTEEFLEALEDYEDDEEDEEEDYDSKVLEIKKSLDEMRAQLKAKFTDKTDDEIDEMILNGFLDEYYSPDSEMTKDDLLGIMDLMGYEPTEEFLAELDSGERPVKEDSKGKDEEIIVLSPEELEDLIKRLEEDNERKNNGGN